MFEIENTSSFNTDMLTEGDQYDYVTRTSLNQGILKTTGFVNVENINNAGTWSLGLLQMDFFYRKKPWYAGQFVRKIIPKIEISEKASHFFTAILNKQKTKMRSVLVRNVDQTFKEASVKIPITQDGKINFVFMETFIAELEAQRYAELEAQRYAELEAYLSVTGLKDTHLSPDEEQALQDFDKTEWRPYKMSTLFHRVETKKLCYKAKDLPKTATGKYVLPCLTSSFQNQGLNYYVPMDGATVLQNVISIPSNSDVYRAYFQPKAFTVLSDAYAIQWKNSGGNIANAQYLFFVSCINKVTDLPIYSYKNKLGGWNVVQNKYIQVPVKDGKINFEFMSNLISAIQKLVIRDVVSYSDQKLVATKQIIEND